MSRAGGAALALAAVIALPVEAADRPPAPVAAATPVGVVVDSTDAPALGARVRMSVRQALDGDSTIITRPLDVGGAQEPAGLGLADGALQKAGTLFREMDLELAKASIEQATKGYEDNLVALVRRDGSAQALRDAHVLSAKVRFFEGNLDAAKDALRPAFALDPRLAFTPQIFPAQMKRVVIEARLLFDALGFGKIEVTSDPPGAVVYLNGHRQGGVTPLALEAAAGPNIIELQAPGHATERRVIDVGSAGSKGDPRLNVRLQRSDAAPVRARELAAELGATKPPGAEVDPVLRALEVDNLIVVHVATPAEGRFTLSGAVYLRPADATSKRGAWAPRVERSGASPSLEGEAEALARSLLATIHERDRALRAAADKPRAGGAWQRFRASKAFWWVVGGVGGALVVGVAVGAGVGASEAHRRELQRQTVILGGN